MRCVAPWMGGTERNDPTVKCEPECVLIHAPFAYPGTFTMHVATDRLHSSAEFIRHA